MVEFPEKEPTGIKAEERKSISQNEVIDFHRLRWREKFGKEYQHIYNETEEYVSFVDTDQLGSEQILGELLKIYKKSLIKGENNVVIDRLLDGIISDLSCVRILKEGEDKKAFLCRIESFFDNIDYGIE